MAIVSQVAIAMQAVFGNFHDDLARNHGLRKRQRKFSGMSLLRDFGLDRVVSSGCRRS